MIETNMNSREQFFLNNMGQITSPTRVIYAIRHDPTKAMFIGRAVSALATFDHWYYRLRSIVAHPPLNWALRAVYTMRSDFTFVIVETFHAGVPDSDVDARVEIWLKRNKARGPEFNLNCGKGMLEKAYWATRVPEPWRFERQKKHTIPKKVKLIPGKVKEAGTLTPDPILAEETDPLVEINNLRIAQGKAPLPKLE